MRLSLEELTANIDDDFKGGGGKLQKTFQFHGRKPATWARHTYLWCGGEGGGALYCSGGLPGQRHIRARQGLSDPAAALIAGRSRDDACATVPPPRNH